MRKIEFKKYIKNLYHPDCIGLWGLSMLITSLLISNITEIEDTLIKIIYTLYLALGLTAVVYFVTKISKRYKGINEIYWSVMMFVNLRILFTADWLPGIYISLIIMPAVIYYFLIGISKLMKEILTTPSKSIIDFIKATVFVCEAIVSGYALLELILLIIK